MDWFRRLGLQRRIMLYVAIGLALMFTIGAYFGLLAIQQATDLVYRERLGTAFTTAATLEHNLQWLAHDVESARNRLLKAKSPEELQKIGNELLSEMSAPSPLPLVRTRSLWFVDLQEGNYLAFPNSARLGSGTFEVSFLNSVQKPTLFAPIPYSSDSSEPLFGSLAVPVKDDAGISRWVVILHLAALNEKEPYTLPTSGMATSTYRSDLYGLEVMNPNGIVALTIGGGIEAGKVSPHWSIYKQQTSQSNESFVFVHRPKKEQHFAPHVIAVVPLGSTPFLVVLEQREDVALALPWSLRQRLIVFGSLGFLATMIVAWVTTRHVVKPTEQLTSAAQRIAEGEVEAPITVVAQDEIGTLAESLEIMRRRLQAWGSELETQVQERTSQLEERNRELRMLYETLQKKEEQLRSLLEKVLRAQEDERKRVSRELHDGIGQALSALTMGLERLEQAKPEQWTHLEEHVDRLKELAKDTLSDLRRLTIALRPAALDDLGLVPAIRRYGELYLENSGIEFHVRENGLNTRLDPYLETVIYRVVQEAINNVARHSAATQTEIDLQLKDGTFRATVKDNGRGFDTSAAYGTQSVGLQGMHERAALAGGGLTVDSKLGLGTTVRLEIPVEERVKSLENV